MRQREIPIGYIIIMLPEDVLNSLPYAHESQLDVLDMDTRMCMMRMTFQEGCTCNSLQAKAPNRSTSVQWMTNSYCSSSFSLQIACMLELFHT